MGSGLQKGFALIGSAVALGGLTHLVKGALETGDAIGDLATKLGLSTDALQEYEHAAQLSGISSTQFETALTRLNKSIAEGQDPNSKAAKLFSDLGISVRDAAGNIVGTEPVLTQFLARLGEIPNAQQRLQASIALGGKSMANFAILAAEGADGIAKMRQEAHEMGLVLDAETIRQVGTLNDRWDTMTKVLQLALLPELIKMAPLFISIAQTAANAAMSVARFFNIKPLDLKITEASQEVLGLQQHIDALRDDMERPIDQRSFPNAGVEILKHYEEQLDAAKTKLSELQKQFGSFAPKPGAQPAIDLESLATKGKKGPKSPDFEGIFNRFAEEAAHTEASLQERIATITGDVVQLQTTALAEVAARRQTSIHQAKGDVQALAQIEKTAALETLAVQLNVIEQINAADKQHVQDAEDAARRRLDTIQSVADTQRTIADNNLDSIRLQQDLADSQGAPLERLIQLRQQEAEAIRAAADVEVDASRQKIAAAQEEMRVLKEQLDARKLLVSDITAARDAATSDLDRALQEARLIELNRALQETQDKYDAIARSVQGWGDEQTRVATQVQGSLARIAEEQRRATAPISERVFERLTVEARGAADRVADAWVDAMDRSLDALLNFAETGKFSFKDLLSIANDLSRTLTKELFKNAIGQLVSGGEGGQKTQGGLLGSILNASFPTPQRPLQQPTAGSAITGPFESSTLTQQLEGLQVPLLQSSTAGIQQLATVGATATQTLTQASTASLTSIQTTSTTAITSIQQVTITALAAIQAAAAGGGGGAGVSTIAAASMSTPGSGTFSNVTGGSSSAAASAVPVPVIPPETFTPVITSMQTTGQQVTQSVGQTGQAVITETGSTGQGILSQLGDFASNALSSLSNLFSSLSGSGSSGGGGDFFSMFSSLFSSFGGSGGSFGNVTSGSSSTAAIIPVGHSGGMIGKTTFPMRTVPPALFAHAPRFHDGLKTLQSAQVARHFVPVMHGGAMNGNVPQMRALPDISQSAARSQGRLKPDEFPAILQTGETVLSRSQVKEIHKEVITAQTSPEKNNRLTQVLAPIFQDAPRFHDGLMSSDWMMPQTGEMWKQGNEIRQKTDMVPYPTEGETKGKEKGQTNIFNFHGVKDFDSFKRNEQQLQAFAARSTSRASKRNN